MASFASGGCDECLGYITSPIIDIRNYYGEITSGEAVHLVLSRHNPNAIFVEHRRGDQLGQIDRHDAAVLAPFIKSNQLRVEGVLVDTDQGVSCKVQLFVNPAMLYTVCKAINNGGLELTHPELPDRDVDLLFSRVGSRNSQIKPMEAPEDLVSSPLLEHQKEALGWLVHKEESDDLPPFWEEDTLKGVFQNLLTNEHAKERPAQMKGGIFADDMGLGKTLTLLSLIGRSAARNVDAEKADRPKRRKLEDAGEVPRSTLVVCPNSVLTTWITQMQEHLKPNTLKMYVYHGERTKDEEELLEYDIILTSYATLAAEFVKMDSPIQEIEWFRIILDEAHLIKNPAAVQVKAVTALKSQRRWAVTGTPIQNSSFDLHPIMSFLQFQPFAVKSHWRKLIQSPLQKGDLSRLKNLLAAISLRRTKDAETGSQRIAILPSKSVSTSLVELSAKERESYDLMEQAGKDTVWELRGSDSITRNYSTVLYFILRLRQLCNDGALCPPDINTLFSAASLKDVANNPELLRKLSSVLDDGDDFDCPVCLSPPATMVITTCAHVYCRTCITQVVSTSKAQCPMCRHDLSDADLFVAPEVKHPDEEGSCNVGSDRRPLSSKVQALLTLLQASQGKDPMEKSVVFSQFRKMLLLLEEPLKQAGFKILRLDGSMTQAKRLEVIQQFAEVGVHTPTVLLASLKSAGAGLNLTAASTVYLFEPWWSPTVEEQAMDRVHRIGQKKEVKVIRLIVKNSIEERILSLQEKKKKLISSAFEKEVMEEDIRMMFGLK